MTCADVHRFAGGHQMSQCVDSLVTCRVYRLHSGQTMSDVRNSYYSYSFPGNFFVEQRSTRCIGKLAYTTLHAHLIMYIQFMYIVLCRRIETILIHPQCLDLKPSTAWHFGVAYDAPTSGGRRRFRGRSHQVNEKKMQR